MKNSKLFQILAELEEADLIRMQEFVNSPFYNKHPAVSKLLFLLSSHFRESNPTSKKSGTELSPESIFKVIHPHRPFDDLRLRHTMSLLVKCIEEYLVDKERRLAFPNPEILLMRAYSKLGLNKYFTQSHRKALAKQEALPIRNSIHHFQQSLIYQEVYNETSLSRRDNAQEPILNYFEEFDSYYLSAKLQAACSYLANARLFDLPYDHRSIESLLKLTEEFGKTEVPAVAVYLNTLHLLSGKEPEHAFALIKQQLVEYATFFTDLELRTLYLIAINFCIKQLNTGHSEYAREVFELFKNSLEGKLLFTNNVLTPWTYKNIVSAGIKMKEFAWVEVFLETYTPYLLEEFRESAFKYNSARLCMAQDKFEKVISLLFQIHIKDTFTNLDAKTMLVKAFYELREFRSIESTLESFRKTLRRKEVYSYHRKNYLNFIRFTKRLMNLGPIDTKGRAKLRKAILEVDAVTEKEWILDKLDS